MVVVVEVVWVVFVVEGCSCRHRHSSCRLLIDVRAAGDVLVFVENPREAPSFRRQMISVKLLDSCNRPGHQRSCIEV